MLTANFFLLERIPKFTVLSTWMFSYFNVPYTDELGGSAEQHTCQRPRCTASSIHAAQWASQSKLSSVLT